jgi:hypothetical protein
MVGKVRDQANHMHVIDSLRTWAKKSGFKERFPQLHAFGSMALGHPEPLNELRALRYLLPKTGLVVSGGPFKGMKYINEATGSRYMPKLVGSYECELNPVLNDIISAGYEVIIDIGCAEGYYAVGLAMRMPNARVYAFDTDKHAQDLCLKLAKLNGVEDRVIIGGFCDTDRLNKIISGKTFLLCDCEGYELELIDSSKAPALNQADMIVELHDFVNSEISSTIISRFKVSHDIVIIDSVKERAAADFPVIAALPNHLQQTATNEVRPGVMQWAWMCANRNAVKGG